MSFRRYTQKRPVTIYSVIPGQQVTDPNVAGIFGIQDALQLQQLSVVLAQVGASVQVVFIATNIGSGSFLGLPGGSVENVCDNITGLAATQDNIVVAKFSTQQICVGPYSGAIGDGQDLTVNLQSLGVLPSQYAGGSLYGATLNAYVGPESELGAYRVGDTFTPDLNTMLQASVGVTGTAPPFPGGGGSGTGGGGGSGGGGTPSGGGGSGGGSGKPPGTTTGQTKPTTKLTTTEIGLGVLGLALLGGGVYFATQPGR